MHAYWLCFVPVLVEARPECIQHEDCASAEVCHQGSCQPACHLETCGTYALCFASNHLAKCECPPGTTGNPTVACLKCKWHVVLHVFLHEGNVYSNSLMHFFFSLFVMLSTSEH